MVNNNQNKEVFPPKHGVQHECIRMNVDIIFHTVEISSLIEVIHGNSNLIRADYFTKQANKIFSCLLFVPNEFIHRLLTKITVGCDILYVTAG